jgi:hypothetical protein
MGSGWADGDDQAERRRNREWILRVLTMDGPVYDIDNVGAITANAVAVDGDDILQTETIHYTVPAGLQERSVVWITVTNNAGGPRDCHVHLVPSGGSRTYTNQIWAYPLEGHQTIRLGPYVANAGATLRTISTNATADEVALRADVLHLTDDVAGIELGGAVGGGTMAWALQYTVPGSGVRQALVSSSLTNNDTVVRNGAIMIVPSGGGIDAQYLIQNALLASGESQVVEWITMDPGDAVYAGADANGVVGSYLTVVEFATP